MSGSGDFSMMDLFRAEAESHTAALSDGLLALENNRDDVSIIEPLMRAAHSIKGAARIVGLNTLVTLAHAMEDCFVAAQERKITLTPGHVDVLFKGVDFIAKLKGVAESELNPWFTQHDGELQSLQAEIRRLAEGGAPSEGIPVTASAPAPEAASVSTSAPATEAVPVESPTPSAPAETASTATPHTEVSTSPTPQVSPAESPLADKNRVVRVAASTLEKLLGIAAETLVQTSQLEPFGANFEQIKKQQIHISGLITQLRHSLESEISKEEEEDLWRELHQEVQESIQLIAQRMMELDSYSRRAMTLTERLYYQVIIGRMRPFKEGTAGLPRMVRDLGRQLGKHVRLEILGQDTLVDRDSLEKLEAPLGHLVRNALDHGIESPATRDAAGKLPEGVLRVEARHHAGMLYITIADDGGGIDLSRIRAKAIAKGLVPYAVATHLSEAELFTFMFLPGFSTAQRVTEISGRGVGLDVVQTTLQQLGGTARVQSILGKGTTFTLQLPVTRSVIRALLVTVAGEPYAFPLARIERTLKTTLPELETDNDRVAVRVGDRLLPLVSAAEVLGFPPEDLPRKEICVVVVGEGDKSYAVEVDSFTGQQRLVVRPLDQRLGKIPDVSAAAVLEDGRALLILDVEDLAHSIESQLSGGNLSRIRSAAEPVEERKSRHVLVVDDSLTVRELERKLLEQAGYVVDCAVDGMEGWNAVRLAQYDLVISDIDMPRMNGIELVRHIRQDARLKSLPIVIVSYKEREEDRMRGLEAGANYYLTKSSFHDASLIHAVVDLIGEARP